MLQHGTWQVFRGDSTSKSALIAEVTPSLVSLGGKTIRVCTAFTTPFSPANVL